MNKTLGVSLTTLVLLFGGAGVAQASETVTPASGTTTTLAADTEGSDDGDDTGLWGLLGLLGLFGLAGLKRRGEVKTTATTARPGASGI